MVTQPACVVLQDDGVTLLTVDDSVCVAAGQPRPVATTSCNVFPCPSAVSVWATSPWSVCTAPASSGAPTCGVVFGNATRAVTCTSSTGSVVADALCASSSDASNQTAIRPTASKSCVVGSTSCGCTSDADCGGGNKACVSAQCVCSDGWGGSSCTVPLIVSSSGAVVACTGGVVDNSGVCCTGVIDTVTGVCCGEGSSDSLDRAGRCCAGVVDVCGVCDGGSIAVDVTGRCCGSALPPSGLCCDHAVIDSCGVCGGTNSCNTTVSAVVSDDWLASGQTVSAAVIADLLGISPS